MCLGHRVVRVGVSPEKRQRAARAVSPASDRLGWSAAPCAPRPKWRQHSTPSRAGSQYGEDERKSKGRRRRGRPERRTTRRLPRHMNRICARVEKMEGESYYAIHTFIHKQIHRRTCFMKEKRICLPSRHFIYYHNQPEKLLFIMLHVRLCICL